MRLLVSSTAVSVLLLSLAAVTSSPQSGDQPVVYEDQCQYGGYYYKCGDKCLHVWSECDCGGDILSYEEVPTHHCCSAAPCTQTEPYKNVTCEAGEVLNINIPCHGKCYADISTNKWLDYYLSRYSCPGGNECLKVSTMCQGLCSAEICTNKTLRCDEIDTHDRTEIIKIASLNRSEVIEEHSYCAADSLQANKIYNSIDRSDEDIENTLTITDTRIDFSYLTNCTTEYDYPGVTCYQSSNKTEREMTDCRNLYDWCRSDRKDSCIVNNNGEEISTNSKTLCSNNTMWKYIPTGYCYKDKFRGNGTRCNGTSQHQINPWYKYLDGQPAPFLKQNCEDFSDRIHTAEAPCPNQTHFLNIHRNLWCNNSLVNRRPICTNSSWSPNTESVGPSRFDDPHFCRDSCQVPGPGCIACTNKDYFQ